MENTYSVNNGETVNKTSKIKKYLRITGVVLGTLTLLRMAFPPTSISVTGIGEKSAEVEKVSMIVTRANTSPLTSFAVQSGEEGLNALIEESKTIVGEEAEIKKSFYTISKNSSEQLVGSQLVTASTYQVSNGFKITFDEVGKVNELIEALYNNGASSVSNITFIPKDKDKVEKEVRKEAVKNARKEGRKIASSMGRILGRVKTLADDQVELGGTTSSGEGSVGIEKIDITKAVSVVYELW